MMTAEQERKTPAQMFPEWFAETEGPNAWAYKGPNAWAYIWRGRFAEIYHEWFALQAELQASRERERELLNLFSELHDHTKIDDTVEAGRWLEEVVEAAQRTEEASDAR